MDSLIGGLIDTFRPSNAAPVSFAPGRLSNLTQSFRRGSQKGQMEAYGSVGTLFSIVSTLANATSQVSWGLYRKRDGRGRLAGGQDRIPVANHAAMDLWNKPNPFFTRQRFVEGFQQHIDLTGEGWWVVYRDSRFDIPLELWYVRPDRIYPVPHPTEYLSGYVYCGPDGEKVPLGLDEVIPLQMPNPLDPYRGMGPVQSLLADLDSTRFSAEWNRNFFLNSAEPGGIIMAPSELSDPQFDRLRSRWNEQHRGVAGAHRVAILENGLTWQDRSYSMKDMQFVELRQISRDVIMEAYGMSKFSLGIVDDVNRASAEASKAWFGEYKTIPRLERIKGVLNNNLLPMFGTTAEELEFDYDNPVPPNREQENAELNAKVQAFTGLVSAGVDPESAAEVAGLPPLKMRELTEPAPVGSDV